MIKFIRHLFSGNRVVSLAGRYERLLNRGNSNQILREQYRMLSELLCYAQLHSQYYYHLLQNKEITMDNCMSILKDLPLLSKLEIRENGFNIYSDEISSEWGGWLNTGGSTGEPLCFPSKLNGISLELVHQQMLYSKMGWQQGETIVAIDGSRVGDFDLKHDVYWVSGDNFPYGKYSYSTLYMNESTLGSYVNSLNEKRPSILRGYPSGFIEISHYMLRHKLSFKFKPKGIYLTSEQFSEADRALISSVFGTSVYGQYGHTESSVFAITEKDSMEYICSPFYGITEVLDDEGNQVKVGEIGEIVVTGFSNVALPFIRYKTGDLAVFGGIKKGCVALTSLLGRTIDYVLNLAGDKVYLIGLIFGGHLRAFKYVLDWQIQQDEVGMILLRIVKSVEYTEGVESEIMLLFARENIKVRILYLSELPRTQRGKKRFMIQNCI